MSAWIVMLTQVVLEATTPAEASSRFFDAVESMGATYIQTRVYTRPDAPLTSASHWAAGGFVLRRSPKQWPGSSAFNYVCFEHNPLLGAIRQNRTRYRFSDFASRDDPAHGAYWDALSEGGMAEVLCATSYGRERGVASLHLGFGEQDIDPAKARTVQHAGLILTERLMDFYAPQSDEYIALTPRELDSMAFVAEGKTDGEISGIFGVSEATVRFHVDNARRKLGAATRAQAVAKIFSRGML